MKIELQAILDLDAKPNECRIKPVDGPWTDFGYYLEAVSLLATLAMKEKRVSKQEILDYAREYMDKAMSDYDKSRN